MHIRVRQGWFNGVFTSTWAARDNTLYRVLQGAWLLSISLGSEMKILDIVDGDHCDCGLARGLVIQLVLALFVLCTRCVMGPLA